MAFEVGSGQVEQHFSVVEVVELAKTILILWNGVIGNGKETSDAIIKGICRDRFQYSIGHTR